jgi:hypothetical protein
MAAQRDEWEEASWNEWEELVDEAMTAYNDVVVQGQHTFFAGRPTKNWYELAEAKVEGLPVCFQVYKERLDAAWREVEGLEGLRLK